MNILKLFSPSGQKVEIKPTITKSGQSFEVAPEGLGPEYDNYRFEGARVVGNKYCYTVGEYKAAQIGDSGNWIGW